MAKRKAPAAAPEPPQEPKDGNDGGEHAGPADAAKEASPQKTPQSELGILAAARQAADFQNYLNDLYRSPVRDVLRDIAMRDDILRTYRSPVQDYLDSLNLQQDFLTNLYDSPLQQAARNIVEQSPGLTALGDAAKAIAASPAATLAENLRKQNLEVLNGIRAFARISEAPPPQAPLSDPAAATEVRRQREEQKQVLDDLKTKVESSTGQAQAFIKAVEDLPEKDKAEAIEATQQEVVAAATWEVLLPVAMEWFKRQEAVDAQNLRIADLTAKLVSSSETLVRVTEDGQTEAKRRDDANEAYSANLKRIAEITLAVAVISAAIAALGVMRDAGWFGQPPDPTPLVIVVYPTPAATLLPTPSPVPKPSRPTPTPAPTPTPELSPSQQPSISVPS